MQSLRKIAITAGVGLGLTLVTAAPALASTSVSSDLVEGSKGTNVVGSASFERTTNGDGTESLHVVASVPVGALNSHLCVSAAPFTAKESPGSCQFDEGGGTSIDFTVNLGTTYVAQVLYIQFHVDLPGQKSAFAGWQSGSPFYGNLGIDPPETPVPVGAVGAVVLAGLMGLAFIVVQRRTVRRGARTTADGA